LHLTEAGHVHIEELLVEHGLLEEWREQILPLHVEKWENLDDKKKTEIISINDFYCGMLMLFLLCIFFKISGVCFLAAEIISSLSFLSILSK
jgi:hypothetical protein